MHTGIQMVKIDVWGRARLLGAVLAGVVVDVEMLLVEIAALIA